MMDSLLGKMLDSIAQAKRPLSAQPSPVRSAGLPPLSHADLQAFDVRAHERGPGGAQPYRTKVGVWRDTSLDTGLDRQSQWRAGLLERDAHRPGQLQPASGGLELKELRDIVRRGQALPADRPGSYIEAHDLRTALADVRLPGQRTAVIPGIETESRVGTWQFESDLAADADGPDF